MASTRQLQATEISLVLNWAAAEGWNPGLEDGPAFFSTDPQGFFISEVDGQPVAAISVVNHGPDHAFLGLYLCQPDYRGRGIGYALWQHALQHAGDRTIGLDGVTAQQANYARSGFVLTGASTRFQGTFAVPGNTPADPAIRPGTMPDIPVLIALDSRANSYARPAFVSHWMCDSLTRRTLVFDQGRGPQGCVTIRQCREGAKIGPLIASDFDMAMRLAHAAAGLFTDGPLLIDLPAHQPVFADALRKLGFIPGFATARMYKGKPPRPDSSLWSIATMELG